jgi:hypothetical protein
MDFILIDRIVRDKSGKQVPKQEVICVHDIHSFRPWMPGENDSFGGKATILVMKASSRMTGQKSEKFKDSDEGSEGRDDKNGDKLPTMLILEDFTNFIKRMSGRVILMGNAE